MSRRRAQHVALQPQQKKAINKQVKSLIKKGEELKYFVTNTNVAAVTNVMGINDISAIPQGTNDSQRVGDRLEWCGKLQIRGRFVNGNGTTAELLNFYRYIVIQWHPNTVPTVADILLKGPTTAPQDIYSHFNHDNRQQYKVLYDKMFMTVSNGSPTTQAPPDNLGKHFNIIVNMKKASKQVQFNSGTTIGTNRIYYILGSDSNALTHPTYLQTTKMFYRDG